MREQNETLKSEKKFTRSFPLDFRFTFYSTRRSERGKAEPRLELLSKPFYSHFGGYKLQIVVKERPFYYGGRKIDAKYTVSLRFLKSEFEVDAECKLQVNLLVNQNIEHKGTVEHHTWSNTHSLLETPSLSSSCVDVKVIHIEPLVAPALI